MDHYGGLIRNNFINADSVELFTSPDGFGCGICLWQACGARVLHNTVASTQAPFSSLKWRFPNTDVSLINNLVTPPCGNGTGRRRSSRTTSPARPTPCSQATGPAATFT